MQRTALHGRAGFHREVGLGLADGHQQRQVAVRGERLDRELPQVGPERPVSTVDEGQKDFAAEVARTRPLGSLPRRREPLAPADGEERGRFRRARPVPASIEGRELEHGLAVGGISGHARHRVDFVVHRVRAVRHQVVLVVGVGELDPVGALREEVHGGRREERHVRRRHDRLERRVRRGRAPRGARSRCLCTRGFPGRGPAGARRGIARERRSTRAAGGSPETPADRPAGAPCRPRC